MFIWDFVADTILEQIMDWVYKQIIEMCIRDRLTPYGMVNREDFGPLHEPISEQQQEQTQEPQMGM